MSRKLICFVILGTLFSPLAATRGEEQPEQFLDGLRSRGYYDYALYFLDKLEERTDLPAEIKQVIPYERAITLLEGARTINNPEVRDEQLDRAVAQLDAFTRANPKHPLAAKANTEQARILIEKARVKIWEANSPANEQNSEKFRLEARALLAKARQTFQTAHDLHKAAYEKFRVFVDPSDKEKFEARGKAEIDYMRAQLDLALCTYEEAQTFPAGSQEFKNLLNKAADEFKEIHTKYRSIVGGLYARMWQGKCFEEQNDIGKALGIYNELLAHPGKSRAMQTVQNQVLQFRLICLNHEQRKDYQLVINEAGQWLAAHRKEAGTSVGLGIRYEKAVAHEKLADKLKTEYEAAKNQAERSKGHEPLDPKKDIEGNLRLAMNEARQVTQYAGQYQAPSQFMVSRLKGKLGLSEGDPKNIEEALVRAVNLVQQIEGLEADIQTAKTKQETANRQEALHAHLNQIAQVLSLGLKLANERTNLSDINKARFWLAYIYYKLERNFEAGVIGEFLANHFAEEDPKMAQQAANIALGAYNQAYNARTKADADEGPGEPDVAFELDQMLRVAEGITKKWPGSGLADTSRMLLGKIYSRLEKPVEAAKWFTQVASSDKKGMAKVSAGQAYWNAYLKGAVQAEEKRPKPEELAAWQENSKKFLSEGIDILNNEVPQEATVEKATDLIAARVTLAQIFANEQNYDAAILYLTDGKKYHHPPLEAVKVQKGEQRPERGVKSQNFARLVYQVLLRAYVGKQQTDAALKAMDDLENLVGKDNSEELTRTYVELGKQIRSEIERLQNGGPKDRLDAILASFNSFLNALLDRKDQMSYGSLQWMAETFLNLGISLKDAPGSNATEYFKKAEECYQAILDRAQKEAEPPKWLTGIKVRLANTSRSAGNYEKALDILKGVLKDHPRSLDVQIAAAETLQDWGTAGRPESPQKLIAAIQGLKLDGQTDAEPRGLWGWGGMSNQLISQLRPVRGRVRSLRTDEEKIIAYGNTLSEKADRESQVEAAKAAGSEDLKDAEDRLAVITDALAATKTWLALRLEQQALEAAAKSGRNQDRLNRIEQINRTLSHMVDSKYFGDFEETRKTLQKELAGLQGKSDDKSKKRIADVEKKLEEMDQEKNLLPPAYRTGQRLIRTREKLYLRLTEELAALKKLPAGSSSQQLQDLQAEIDAVKPEGITPKRLEEVREEMAALAKAGQAPTKKELQQELKTLRNAVNAWTAYPLVQDAVKTPLAELSLDNEELRVKLQEKKAQLAQQLGAEEAKEAATYDRLLDVLYHVSESRYKYAQVQSSTAEKSKSLQAAKIETANLTRIIPREDISTEWWNKFNAIYKTIQTDLNPLVDAGDRVDPPTDIPEPEGVTANLTWLERPSVTAVVGGIDGPEKVKVEQAEPPPTLSMTWVILAVLLALAGTGGAVYLMMGAQKKKPIRVTYGAGPMMGGDEKITVPGEGFGGGGESPPPKRTSPSRPARKSATGTRPRPQSAASASATGEAPRKKPAPQKRPPQQAAGEPPKPKPKPRPSE